MKTYEVIAAGPFQAQLRHEQAFWYAKRDKNPWALDDGLDALMENAASAPWTGQRVKGYPKEVRSMLIKKTQHRVAFRINDDDDTVLLLAIWGTAEGKMPDL